MSMDVAVTRASADRDNTTHHVLIITYRRSATSVDSHLNAATSRLALTSVSTYNQSHKNQKHVTISRIFAALLLVIGSFCLNNSVTDKFDARVCCSGSVSWNTSAQSEL